MAQTLLQIQHQIEQLRITEARLKQSEAAKVIGRIKVAIAAYGLTPEDLFGTTPLAAKKASVATETPQAKGNSKTRYADGKGNEWGGRGPRPYWLRAEIEAGNPLSDFETGRHTTTSVAAKPDSSPRQAPVAKKPIAKVPHKRKAKQRETIRFRDDKGNAWTGKGWMPLWMKTEIEATGKTKEDFRVVPNE